MTSICIICRENTKKYKCSKCTEPYCSLGCFKKHQQTDCQAPEKPPPPVNGDDEPTIFFPFPTEDTVDPAKLEQLITCEPLKNLLYNPHLRSLLKEIDVAPNAWNAMRVAMQEPLFIEFADECLKVIEPPTDEDCF